MRTRREGRAGRRILFSTVTAAAGMSILISVIAVLIDKGTLQIGSASLLGKICFAISCLLGCCLAARRVDSRKLLYAGGVGGTLMVLITCIVLFDQDPGSLRLWIPAAITVCAIAIAAVSSAGSGRRGYR